MQICPSEIHRTGDFPTAALIITDVSVAVGAYVVTVGALLSMAGRQTATAVYNYSVRINCCSHSSVASQMQALLFLFGAGEVIHTPAYRQFSIALCWLHHRFPPS